MNQSYSKYENLRLDDYNDVKKPLVSLITVVKNNKEYIQETFDSIRSQSSKNFEYIVIDGNSTDGTQEVIEKNKDIINFYLSEEDKNLWDGFNKGMALAKGEFIGFINSDDKILPDAMKIFESYTKKKNFDFFLGVWKNIGEYYTDINLGKYVLVGVFTVVIPLDFIYDRVLLKKWDITTLSINIPLIMIIFIDL